jgi:hypothetical protein
MTSGMGGLDARIGSYGAFIEARYAHRYERDDSSFPTHSLSLSGGLVF